MLFVFFIFFYTWLHKSLTIRWHLKLCCYENEDRWEPQFVVSARLLHTCLTSVRKIRRRFYPVGPFFCPSFSEQHPNTPAECCVYDEWLLMCQVRTHWYLILKVHCVAFEEKYYFMVNKPNKQTLCSRDWKNKLTLKRRISNCFTSVICGGPCHLSSFKQCSGDLIYLWEHLVYLLMEKN